MVPDTSGVPADPRWSDDIPPPGHDTVEIAEHKKVGSTRTAVRKLDPSSRSSIGGRGKFRLLVSAGAGERACRFLDALAIAIDDEATFEATEQGYAVNVRGEVIGFMIEEKLDRVPHVITPAEIKEKAEHERKCALADRGIGYRPWRPPAIPEYDYVPNGELMLKFDHDYAAGGTRRVFSDGKRQRLEDLIPAMLVSLGRWAIAVKARRDELERWQREAAEREQIRRERENQVRVEGYRIAFLQRQVERKREVAGLTDLIAGWETAEDVAPQFSELLDFARLYRDWLETKVSPAAIAERINELKLMEDNVYIYDVKKLD